LTPLAAPHFPFLGEATARLTLGAIGASLVCLGALGAGTLVLHLIRLRTGSHVEHLVLATASGFLVISCSSFLLAGLGQYRPAAVAVLIAAACFAGAAARRELVDDQPPPRSSGEDATATAAWLALAAAALAFGVVAALAPEKEYDALWYHLNLPRLWLEAGRPVDLVEEYISLYPLTWDLVFGAGLVLGGAVAAKLLHFVCLPLLAGIVWLSARRYVCRASAAAAVALVVTTPTLLWESSTAYVDLALAMHAAIACYALARHAERGDLAWGALAALHFGGAAATKHLGVVVTIIALTLFVVVMVRSGVHLGRSIRRALLIGVAAALIPLPWYARSWMASGNPVFPDLFSVFGALPLERWDAVTERGLAGFKARFGYGRSPADLIRLPWDVTVHGDRFGGCLGPLFLMLIPGACVLRLPCRAVLLLAAAVMAYAAVWASAISSYQMRFLMPVVAPMALLAAAGLDAVAVAAGGWHRRGRQLVTAAMLAVAFLNLPPFIRLHERDRQGWTNSLSHVLRQSPVAVVAGRESEVSYLRRELPAFAAWQFINKELPDDVRVLTFAGGDQFYARRRRVSYDATIARPAVAVSADDIGAAAAALRALGITHVLFERHELARLDADKLAIGSPALQQACAVVYDDRRVWVCRLEYSRLTE
jgi:4-amino-4-deoxy-L-arabinose transferase-like glycosyltransferase